MFFTASYQTIKLLGTGLRAKVGLSGMNFAAEGTTRFPKKHLMGEKM